MRSPGCITTWPSMQAHTQVWHTCQSKEKTCTLPSLLLCLKAHGQNLKLLSLVIDENYSWARNKLSLTTTVPCHQDFTLCSQGLTLPSSSLQKRQVLLSTLFPTQFGGACLPDTHLPLCMQQQLPNSTAASMKGHGGNGWMGRFLICIIFVMQLNISRKFWRRGGVKIIADNMAFKHSQTCILKRKPNFVYLHLWAKCSWLGFKGAGKLKGWISLKTSPRVPATGWPGKGANFENVILI